jgi:predicted component of type VI protein secretion system
LIEPAPAARSETSKPSPIAAAELRASPTASSDQVSSSDALIAKLAEGLNMPNLAIQPDQMQAFMFELGRMFRITVEGVHSLLLLRAEVKKELRAEDRTMIVSRENNPLKHTESEAEGHFDKLFGREFVRAYMEQTQQLKKRNKT